VHHLIEELTVRSILQYHAQEQPVLPDSPVFITGELAPLMLLTYTEIVLTLLIR